MTAKELTRFQDKRVELQLQGKYEYHKGIIQLVGPTHIQFDRELDFPSGGWNTQCIAVKDISVCREIQ